MSLPSQYSNSKQNSNNTSFPPQNSSKRKKIVPKSSENRNWFRNISKKVPVLKQMTLTQCIRKQLKQEDDKYMIMLEEIAHEMYPDK